MKREVPQTPASQEAEPTLVHDRGERLITLKRIALHAGLATAAFAFVIFVARGHESNFNNHTSEPQEEPDPSQDQDVADQQVKIDAYNRRLEEQEVKKAAVEAHVSERIEKCLPVTYFSGGIVSNYDIYAKQTSARASVPIVVTGADLGIVQAGTTDSQDEPYAVVSVQADQTGALSPDGCPVLTYAVDLTESSDQIRHFTNRSGQDYTIPQIDIQEVNGLGGDLKTGVLYPAYNATGQLSGLRSADGEAVGVLQLSPYETAFTG